MADIHGVCEERFEAVRSALARNLDSGEELGASLVLDIDGDIVIDIWGGFRDQARTVPWDEHTITNVWSSTKTVTSLAALMLVDRGELDVDHRSRSTGRSSRPQASRTSWSGICCRTPPGFPGSTSRPSWRISTTGSGSTSRMAAQAPWWEPGTASGYHALNLRAPGRRGGAADQRQDAEAVRGRGDRRAAGRRFPDRRRGKRLGADRRRGPAAAAAVRLCGARTWPARRSRP